MIRLFLPLAALLVLAACTQKPARDWWGWVIPGHLIAAAAPEKAPGGPDQWLSTLREAAHGKPLAVLNLREKSYPDLASKTVAALQVPIPDFRPPPRKQADSALAFITDNVDRGRVVVVHCHGGCGLTGSIHLLLSDVVMPDINGRELFDKLQAERPGLESLFMSGYTENVIAHHGVLDRGTHFTQKPFTVGSLARAVRNVLDNETS